MFIRKPDFRCFQLRLTLIVLHGMYFDCWGTQDNAISLTNIPTRHGVVTKLQFTWHRSDLQFKFASVRHYNAGTAGLEVHRGGGERRLNDRIYILLCVHQDNKLTATYQPAYFSFYD